MTTRDEREGPAAGEPDVFLQHLTQGGELLAAGHTEEALGYLESALSLSPGDEKAQNLLGLCCFKLGHLDRAAEIYEHLVRENPVDPTLRVNLGLVYLKANAVQRAVREFETATEIAPDHRKAHNYLGLALAQAAEYGRAREHFLLAGSEHMAEKMARALDGEGFEPVTTPAGGVAAVGSTGAPGTGAMEGPGFTPSPEVSDHGALGQAEHWDDPGAPQPTSESWSAEAGWDGGAGAGDAWGDQAGWGEAGAEQQGWAHPDDAAGWAHQEAAPGAEQMNDGLGAEDGGWSQGGAEQGYAVEPGAYGVPEGEAWPEDVGAGAQAYGEAPEAGGWLQEGAEPEAYGLPEGEAWPEDTGAELQPHEQQQADGAWPGEEDEQVSYGEASEDEAWPRDAGADLQPGDQQQEAAEAEGWPQDAGPELQPPPSRHPGAEDGLYPPQSPPLDQDPDGLGAAPGDGAGAERSALDPEGASVEADALPEATSALDDDLEAEPSAEPTDGEGLQAGPVTGEKVASLRPARLEDSWGAQFGLEGEGTEAAEPAEELVVELNASEVAEPEADDVAVGSPASDDAPSSAPTGRDATTPGAGRPEAAAARAAEAAGGSEVPGLPTWEERSGTRASGSGWLVDLARQLELRPGPSTEGFTELGDGVVDLQLREGMRTRTHGYFALEGKVRLTPEPRRIRGRASEQLFGPEGRELMRVQGSGHLLVRVPGRQLLSLELGEEGLFLREAAVYAFEENVMFENGSLSDAEGNEALRLVHLRGTGRLLVELEGALRTVQIREGAPARIELSRIVGWFGELVPQAVAGVTGMSAHLELSGQGFALIDAAHREASA